MNNKDFLRINVGYLLNQAVGTYRDVDFETPHLEIDADFQVENFKGTARLSRVQQGILVQMNCEGDTEIDCVRCLTPYTQHETYEELVEQYKAYWQKTVDRGFRRRHTCIPPCSRQIGRAHV